MGGKNLLEGQKNESGEEIKKKKSQARRKEIMDWIWERKTEQEQRGVEILFVSSNGDVVT